jgi:NAD(P)-dependent dehydrogenase (short-subunit alcohol dehydrogenase family)
VTARPRGSPYRDKVAIVTGAASGIGAALAKELAREGARVVLTDRQLELAEHVARDIRDAGGAADVAEVDVRDLSSVKRVVGETVARHGALDFLFNNAGIAVGGEMSSYAPGDWDDVFDVNLRGVAHGIQAAYPVMIRQEHGHIVNTASLAGLVACPAQGSYTATKHAVVALSKALRLEARRHGVRVSVLCPGVIRTPILHGGVYGRSKLAGLSVERLASMWERLWPMEPDAFAREAVRAVARDEAIIVIPRWWKGLWLLDRLSPSLSARLWAALLERMRGDIAGAGGRPAA